MCKHFEHHRQPLTYKNQKTTVFLQRDNLNKYLIYVMFMRSQNNLYFIIAQTFSLSLWWIVPHSFAFIPRAKNKIHSRRNLLSFGWFDKPINADSVSEIFIRRAKHTFQIRRHQREKTWIHVMWACKQTRLILWVFEILQSKWSVP